MSYTAMKNCLVSCTIIHIFQSPIGPRPPSGKTDKMPSSFRTTMFKRDYEKRQHQIKSKNQKTDDKPVLTVNM